MSQILLTGGRAPYTLHLARLLHHWGHQVYMAESLPHNLTSHSRFIQKTFGMPPPAQNPEKYALALKAALLEASIDLLIPTCEEVFYVAKAYSDLQAHTQILTSPLPVLQQLHSKWDFIQLAHSLGWSVPQTELIDNHQNLKDKLPLLGDFILKPEYSRFSTATYMKWEEVPDLSSFDIGPHRRWVWQQTIRGPAFCSYGVAWQGELKAHCIYPSVYCAGRGATVYFESIRIAQIETQVKQLAKHLNYTGQLALDWIQSDTDGNFYPLECNPRATNGLLLFSESDPLPVALTHPQHIQMLYAGNQHPQMLALAMGLYVWPKMRHWREGLNLLKKMKSARDVVWRWDDPLPFLTQFYTLGHFWRESQRQDISLMAASTYDIEWNGPESDAR